MLDRVDITTRHPQAKPLPLNKCCACLDLLATDVAENKGNAGHALHICKLGTQCIAANASFAKNPVFKRAVVKMQNKNIASLTDIEKEVVKKIEKTTQCHCE